MTAIKIIHKSSIPLIVQGDINIDQWQPNDPLSRPDVRQLNEKLVELKSDINLQQCNFKPTRFRDGQNPSLLDLVLCSRPLNINCIETFNSNVADHKCVGFQYHVKELVNQEQFILIRNWKLVNSTILMNHIESNLNLTEIFSLTDPDEIAKTIILEMNKILEEIAPSRIVQKRSYEKTHKCEELDQLKKQSDCQLEIAINSSDREEYRLYNRLRNKFQRKTTEFSNSQFTESVSTTRQMWREIDSKLSTDKGEAPTYILDGDNVVSSQSKLAILFNDFFVTKIESLRSKFKPPATDPVETLAALIKKPDTSFELRQVEIQETYDIITQMTSTNARGFDYITSKTIKMIPHITSLWCNHLFNSMVRVNRFPKILKITRLLPILKSNKNKMEKSSYRPIANLSVYEKVVEEHIKRQMNSYFEDNDLILKFHHGGRKEHSTITARATIDAECSRIIENNNLGFVLTTDLSSAFDTVDISILIRKLEFYGVGKNTLELMESYLTDRKQYTELQNKQSNMVDSLPCSVVQGSKLSTLMYTIYTNEIPLLHQLLKNPIWMIKNLQKTVTNYSSVTHLTVNYIDDSTSIIGFEDSDQANHYLNNFFSVLKEVYNANRLFINAEKTGLICVARPQTRVIKDEIYIYAQPKNIVCKPQIKLLGWFFNERLSYDSTINQNIGLIQNKINKLQDCSKLLSVKQRTMIANCHMLSLLHYGSPLFIGQDERIIDAVHKCQMVVSRWCRGGFCFKESVNNISSSLGWSNPRQMIVNYAALQIKKVVFTGKPSTLAELIRFPRSRTNAQLGKNFDIQTKHGRKSFMNHAINIYNILPDYLKQVDVKHYKKAAKKFKIEYKPD